MADAGESLQPARPLIDTTFTQQELASGRVVPLGRHNARRVDHDKETLARYRAAQVGPGDTQAAIAAMEYAVVDGQQVRKDCMSEALAAIGAGQAVPPHCLWHPDQPPAASLEANQPEGRRPAISKTAAASVGLSKAGSVKQQVASLFADSLPGYTDQPLVDTAPLPGVVREVASSVAESDDRLERLAEIVGNLADAVASQAQPPSAPSSPPPAERRAWIDIPSIGRIPAVVQDARLEQDGRLLVLITEEDQLLPVPAPPAGQSSTAPFTVTIEEQVYTVVRFAAMEFAYSGVRFYPMITVASDEAGPIEVQQPSDAPPVNQADAMDDMETVDE